MAKHTDRYDDDDGASLMSARDVHASFDAFRQQGAKDMSKLDPDATEKLAGIWEVDAGLATAIKAAFNVGTSFFSDTIQRKSYYIATQLGHKAGLTPGSTNLVRGATIAATAVDVALKMGPYVGPFFEQWKAQATKKTDFARKISTVLDDKVGKHNAAALSAASHDNEMIKVQLNRLNKQAHITRANSMIDLITNSGTNIALGLMFNFGRTKHVWNGGEFNAYQENKADLQKQMKELTGGAGHADANSVSGQTMIQGLFNSFTAPVSERLRAKNARKLKQMQSNYTAMDMVITLQEQVEHNPNARTFQMPGRNGQSCGLDEYIMRVMIQHQKDMADLSPDHTELREALKEDMAEAAKPIAEAIRKGEISALQLITLIGERQVIKSNGRAIAVPEEVESYLDRSAEKPVSAHHTDPKEWLKESSFSVAELKGALKGLHGEERENFAAMFPDSVLEQAGLAAKEIKIIRESLRERYEPMLTECVLGLAKHSDELLQREGLAKHEIKQLREAVKEIEKLGGEAVHSLKAGPTNAHGIERVLTNWSVNNVEYVGRVLDEGREAKAELTEKPKRHSDHVEKHMGRGHAERVRSHNDNEANDNEHSHAERARAEAGHGYAGRH